ncbi:hypothetical protein [Marinirhabdus gelatinilytica]|uniref:Uncharacterized protein n=1 Tax=Marinirhabdus gelatinilytica TaxID=1703343 RepID=A0A370Q779_9FLAO|nr:hypothetical protein [Marinirhabdus gelatinilytica]RDK84197.1 hypothetical protein C8D94_10541 [Marinirhabdus gelatinilytica]
MEHNKDIGNLLKNRLENAEKAPKQTLWERLDNSLEKREKKRRRAAWLWFTGTLLILALLIFGGATMFQDSGKDAEPHAETPPVTKSKNEENSTETRLENTNGSSLEKDTSTAQTDNTETPTATNTKENQKLDTENSPEDKSATTTNNSQKVTNTTTKKTPTEEVTKDGFTITTKHQYYNSDLDTTTVSMSKAEIDSLVAANKRKMAIQDSIARKRAADSIKLNKATRDSIPE